MTPMKQIFATAVIATAIGGAVAARQASCTPPAVPGPTDAAAIDVAPILPAPDPEQAAATDAATDAFPPRCEFTTPRASPRARKLTARIVGGTAALAGAYPFAAALATKTRVHYCGGTLIAPRFVLTAAHCQVEVGDVALVGASDLRSAQAVHIAESRIHPRFDAVTLDNDVAIAVLAENAGVLAATFEGAGDVRPPSAMVIGWGTTVEGGETTSALQQVRVPFWPHADCKKVYPGLTPRQVCAGLLAGGADSCQGDSGGALLTGSAAAGWKQIGIVSYGTGCARPGVPGVYTDVRNDEIRAWITACAR